MEDDMIDSIDRPTKQLSQNDQVEIEDKTPIEPDDVENQTIDMDIEKEHQEEETDNLNENFELIDEVYVGGIDDDENSVNKLLKELMDDGFIEVNEYQEYMTEYKNLDKTLLEIMAKETTFMNKGKLLKNELLEMKRKFRNAEKTAAQTQQHLADLKRDLIKSENQLALAHEAESQLQTSVIETERKIDFLETERKKLIERREDKERPALEKYTADIEDLKNQINHIELNNSKEEEKRLEYTLRIVELEEQLKESERHKMALREELASKGEEPKIAQNQLNIVRQGITAAIKDSEIKGEKISQLTATINRLQNSIEETEKEKNNLSNQIYNLNLTLEKIDEDIQNVKSNILSKKDENAISVSNKFALSHEEQTKKDEQRIEIESLKNLQKQEEDCVKKAYKVESQIKYLEREIHKHEKVKEMLGTEKKRVEEKLEKIKAERMMLDREVDILSHDLFQSENNGDSLLKELTSKEAEVQGMESNITKTADEERELAKEITDLEKEREKKARDAAKRKYLLVESRGELKILSFVNSELQKKLMVIDNEINAKNELYSLMRQERNKCSKAIQDSAQTLGEIREKNKILENEIDVLRGQINEKNKQLNEDKTSLDKRNKESRKLHSESSKLKMAINEKENRKQALQSEIDELNMYIDTTEESMIFLKNRYESGVQERNYTGIQLIDRNDELCILYEKANIQGNIIKEGEIELQKREKELKMLTLEMENVRRETQIVFKRVPEFESLRKEKEDLLRQIEETKKQSEDISTQLEDPSNTSRWRELPGYVPTKEELKDKVQELEEKLNQRSEQLMEKNLMLQEITQSSDESRMEAMQGRDQMYDLALNMNKVQARIRDINKKMMATLSELSVYQATTMELEQSNKELEDMIALAQERITRGEAPSQEHEEQWFRDERLRYKRQLEMQLMAERIAYEKSLPPTVTRTTALQRPGAYIPDDMLGLPKPYMFKPMLFSEPGSTMRHIKKQKNRPIII